MPETSYFTAAPTQQLPRRPLVTSCWETPPTPQAAQAPRAGEGVRPLLCLGVSETVMLRRKVSSRRLRLACLCS